MSHSFKFSLKNIPERLYEYEKNMRDNKYGIRGNFGNQETFVRAQRCRDRRQQLSVRFLLDYTKAFDTCNHKVMAHALRKASVNKKNIRIIVNLN